MESIYRTFYFPRRAECQYTKQSWKTSSKKTFFCMQTNAQATTFLSAKIFTSESASALHANSDYQKLKDNPVEVVLDQERDKVPYVSNLRKPRKSPIGCRPVAATHRSVFRVPQRLLLQCLERVMKTLKSFHYKGFQETKICIFWKIVWTWSQPYLTSLLP